MSYVIHMHFQTLRSATFSSEAAERLWFSSTMKPLKLTIPQIVGASHCYAKNVKETSMIGTTAMESQFFEATPAKFSEAPKA
jgi:hypothetical protein